MSPAWPTATCITCLLKRVKLLGANNVQASTKWEKKLYPQNVVTNSVEWIPSSEADIWSSLYDITLPLNRLNDLCIVYKGEPLKYILGLWNNLSKTHFLKIDFISFISTSSSPNVPLPLKFSKQNSARISHIPCPYLLRLLILLKILLKGTNYEEGLQFSQAFSCAAVAYKLPSSVIYSTRPSFSLPKCILLLTLSCAFTCHSRSK